VGKAIMEMRNNKATGDDVRTWKCAQIIGRRWFENNDGIY
jgi:hypothetical protein